MSRATEAAFPFPSFNGPNAVEWGSPGMTLREYYAGLAMQGLLASETLDYHASSSESLARHAVSKADALLAELAKPVTK
jgi:hypothetical protein